MSAEVIVLGCGVIGASIGYHLARAGISTLLVDRHDPASFPAASWASAGGLRSQGRAAPEQELSRIAARRWPTLEAELDAWLEMSFSGHLHVAETDLEMAMVEKRVAVDAAAGIAISRITPTEINDLWPMLSNRIRLGAYTPGDGQAHPGRAAKAFHDSAVRLGAKSRLGGTAALLRDGDRVTGLRFADGSGALAETVVVAAGAWSAELLAGQGISLPLRWRGLQMLLSDVAPPLLGPTVTAVGRNLSLKQSPSRQLMIGGNWFGAAVPEDIAAAPVEANIARQWDGAVAILPALARQRLAQCWVGVEAQSIDALPFIGPSPLAGLYVATGFSNHGFQISPAVGDLVAEDLTGGVAAALAPFRLDRAGAVEPERIEIFREA